MLSELQVFARLEACVQKSDHQQLLVKEAEMMNSAGEAKEKEKACVFLRSGHLGGLCGSPRPSRCL